MKRSFPGPDYLGTHIAWTNLYPIARNDVIGNPDGILRTVQEEPAALLLDAVALELKPQAVIVLAGTFWPFADRLRLRYPRTVDRPLLASGQRGGRPWIIGMHPGGAQRRGWGASVYAELIDRAVQAA